MGAAASRAARPGFDARSQQAGQAGAGFRSCHLRGVQPSPEVLAKEAAILAPLGPRGLLVQRPSEKALRQLPGLLAEACRAHRITLLDMQAFLLPPWGLAWGTAFPSKAELFAFLGREPSPGCLGELADLELPGSCLNIPDDDMTVRTGRWAELLDGVAVVRLMSDRNPAATQGWADPRTIGAALQSIRQVCWSPRLHWAFPAELRRRVRFLCLLGQRLCLRAVWVRAVMPFVVCAAPDEMQAATWGMRRPGQVIDYYSATNARWMSCRIAATDPVKDLVMIDLKPNHWLTAAEQARLLRPPQIAGAAAARATRAH